MNILILNENASDLSDTVFIRRISPPRISYKHKPQSTLNVTDENLIK